MKERKLTWYGQAMRRDVEYMGKRAIAMDMQGGEYERELEVGCH